jgi:hypothetical protein
LDLGMEAGDEGERLKPNLNAGGRSINPELYLAINKPVSGDVLFLVMLEKVETCFGKVLRSRLGVKFVRL